MKLSDFDYHLPKERIAQYPLTERDGSRLLVFRRGQNKIEHRVFRDLTEYLRQGDVLILNDTKVIPARIYARKTTGGMVEILLIKELDANTWEAVVKGWRHGAVTLGHGISAQMSKNNGVVHVEFNTGDIKKYLNEIGVMPLPPYIKRRAEQSDNACYQTVYAERDGAIAAPTAGLHFTEKLLKEIKAKGVEVCNLTLHVGYGTFKPVVSDDIENHRMDEESYEISAAAADVINRAQSEGRRVIAVGTTVTRTLEAAAYEGNGKWKMGNEKIGRIKAGAGKASIFIYPGCKFRVVNALITNFHLPKSTPMMLTSAFAGLENIKRIYAECSDAGYRFFSYGDAMMIV